MASTRLPDPPAAYDRQYLAMLINQINLQFRALEVLGPVAGSTLNLSQLPTSAAGLRAGDVWRDAGASNVLKIVP